jgi:hypothetical protein
VIERQNAQSILSPRASGAAAPAAAAPAAPAPAPAPVTTGGS